MNRLKRHTGWLGLIAMIIFLASCSSVSKLPNDDIYYSKKVKDNGEYNWDNFQKNAQSYNTGTVESQAVNGSSGDIATTVEGSDTYLSGSNDQYSTDEYGSSYEDRIKRFGDDASSSDFGYYDGYYTNSGYNCGPSSNWSLGFGSYGYGSGWSVGYGYGWPHYYGYGSSYWAGYNAGYWDGYYNGYWGYPYYGYPNYGYPYYGYGGYYGGYYGGGGYYDNGYSSPRVVYGPRNSNGGGTTIPRSGSRSDGRDDDQKSGSYVIGNRNAGGSARGDVSALRSTDRSTGSLDKPVSGTDIANRTTSTDVRQDRDRLNKPISTKQEAKTNNRKYNKPVRTTQDLPKPKYQKPKSYQSLPSQKPRSGQEYSRPVTRTPSTRSNRSNPYIRTTKPASNNRSISNTRSSSSTSRNYSSPSRSNSSRSSYRSTSTRNSGSSSYNRSSGSSSSFRSSGSSSRSSGSSSSRSSGSSSSSSGGGRRR